MNQTKSRNKRRPTSATGQRVDHGQTPGKLLSSVNEQGSTNAKALQRGSIPESKPCKRESISGKHFARESTSVSARASGSNIVLHRERGSNTWQEGRSTSKPWQNGRPTSNLWQMVPQTKSMAKGWTSVTTLKKKGLPTSKPSWKGLEKCPTPRREQRIRASRTPGGGRASQTPGRRNRAASKP